MRKNQDKKQTAGFNAFEYLSLKLPLQKRINTYTLPMVKDLFLMRHAEAVMPSPHVQDFDRPLTQEGISGAVKGGKWLAGMNLRPGIIISSKALRAQETAKMAAEQCDYNPDEIIFSDELYQASVRTFLRVITDQDDRRARLLCVGHNPVINYLAEYLSNEETTGMPPGTIFHLQFETDSWKELSGGTGSIANSYTPA